MRKETLLVLVLLAFVPAGRLQAAEGLTERDDIIAARVDRPSSLSWIGQDLHLKGGELLSAQDAAGRQLLVLQDGFSMSIGANQFFSDKAVVWFESVTTLFRGRVGTDLTSRVYLEGNVSVKKGKGAKTSDLSQTVIKKGQAMVVRFDVSGEVFVTAGRRESADPSGTELYARAVAAVISCEPRFVAGQMLVPDKPTIRRPEEVVPEVEKKPGFQYPVNIAPAGEVALKVERTQAKDGTYIITFVGRLYVWKWQRIDEKEILLELQADNAVVFGSEQGLEADEASRRSRGSEDILAGTDVAAMYVCGDVVMTEGGRTIRADEIYYDFQRDKALAINAVMRNFDVSRGIPIYVRAAKLRQLVENKFTAEDITLTSSEFYRPQISLNASNVIITDTSTVDRQEGRVSDSSYDAQMRDVRLKLDDKTIFYWPFMRSNLQRPDIPIKSTHLGHDNTWGTSIETRWYLARLLGLKEPEGTESTLALDYYGKRGPGAGVEVNYERENYFGRLLGYIVHDTGEDRLGRDISRKDLEPPRELRGRFDFQHRHFMPYNWQLTTGINYESDEHFVESFYRNEFNAGGERETYIHLKRLEDNWALSFLGKGRLNDFADELETLPGAEFHLTGQSLFDDKFTLYSDTELGRLRQRIGNEHQIALNEDRFAFVSHRTELDMPFRAEQFNFVPFVAGSFGYDDRSGFTRTLVDGSNTGTFGDDKVWLGEAGIRILLQPYWKVYPNVKSRLLDLNQLRHIIKPELIAVIYDESDSVVEQRDTLHVGISQRLQTKRLRKSEFAGAGGSETKDYELKTVDWLRLDTDFTWVNDSAGANNSGPDRFIWNLPAVPMRVLSAPDIFNGDLGGSLRRFEMYGPRRNYFGTDLLWRLSDTSAVLSDMNYDMKSGVVQQFNVGFSRLRWPNLSYYIGSRYLRRVEVMDEKGSNAFTFAATYELDPRYTVVFSQQFDFDYGANLRSDIALIRRYHRIYCGLTYSADQSLDRQSIVFSIWPQGVPELAIGPRRYMGLSR